MKTPFFALFLAAASAGSAQRADVSYASLAEGQTLNGFRAAAVYLDSAGQPMGARFVHRKTGFTLDLLQIQSVPQAFIWVTTYPTSDMGEPHTQEHLLLGKGNKGRDLASREAMELVTSSAFTMQWQTCYDFYTAAGPEVFYGHFERAMDALLHPDYTDEEVRREVRNFGVTANPADGRLSLEEKGTVYNEMVTSMDQANRRLYRATGVALYGASHPLAYNSGGQPEALRVLQPADIRKFHADHYFLENMGVVASIPKEMKLAPALQAFDAILNRLQPQASSRPVMTEAQLPAPKPAPAGRIEYIEYPFRNDQQPGSVFMAWPANRALTYGDRTLLELFLAALAGDASTNLYKRFIDSQTREFDFGAKGVSAYVDPDQGNPIFVSFRDVPVARMNDKDLSDARSRVLAELSRIALWQDGSPELAEFNARVRSRVAEQRRALAKFMNSPPGFGFRSVGPEWLMHLCDLNREPGFRKSVTMAPQMEAIEKTLATGRNIWREALLRWKMSGVAPFIEAARPNPALVSQDRLGREQRVAAEMARLKQKYGAADDQAALARYRAESDAAGAAIEKAAKSATPPKFIDAPPLTLDDQLDYKVTRLAGGVPLVASTFDSMSGATTGIALRLDGVPEDRLVFVSLLPELLTQAGVIENGKPVSYEQMAERLRNEVLSLQAGFSLNPKTGRAELVVRGAGNDPAESKKALEWMKAVLEHPDWRPENLSRLRDVVDQTLGRLRTTMQAQEEAWVQNPADAWRSQGNPLLLASGSFLTRAHAAHRLRWMLKDAGAETGAATAFLGELARARGSRDELRALTAALAGGTGAAPSTLAEFAALFAALPPAAKAIAADAARDLDASLAEAPDSSLAADWTYLCNQMRRDLAAGPQKALTALEEVRRSLLTTGGARLFLISSPATQQALAPSVGELAGGLRTAAFSKAGYRAGRRIAERLRGRDPQAASPVFAALLNPNSQGGVFLNSAPSTGFEGTDKDKLLDLLAANLYSGHGAHGLFMKTWAAGLAYSNGVRVRLSDSRLNYYAERTPELPQTLRFVIDEVKKAQPDPALAEYAVALAFDGTRSASPYEARGESMANDLADGLPPETVARFHKAILELRQTPDLAAQLFGRMSRVYASVMPGLGVKARDVPGGVFFVIGPEKQLAAYEEYLKTAEGPDAALFRLWPRDFWLVDE